jgi:hypothetical protein
MAMATSFGLGSTGNLCDPERNDLAGKAGKVVCEKLEFESCVDVLRSQGKGIRALN